VLWDCLPDGRYPGGAPLNVAYHLHRLGCHSLMVSAVGRDAPGEEMLGYLESRRLSTQCIARHPSLSTGTVEVALVAGEPRYEIRTAVAWDEIPFPDNSSVTPAPAAIVFGSLAARSAANRVTLERLLEIPHVLRFFDVNLRPPFDDHDRALMLASRADWVKLNEDELRTLTGFDQREWNENKLWHAAERLTVMTRCHRLCITRAERGAAVVCNGQRFSAAAPRISVRDAVGAGDAFTAAFLHGVLTGKDLRESVRDACALGALVASLPGAQPEYSLTPGISTDVS
jgi:fructokinase